MQPPAQQGSQHLHLQTDNHVQCRLRNSPRLICRNNARPMFGFVRFCSIGVVVAFMYKSPQWHKKYNKNESTWEQVDIWPGRAYKASMLWFGMNMGTNAYAQKKVREAETPQSD